MLFVSRELAARIERAECQMQSDAVASAMQRHPEGNGRVVAVAGGVATWSGDGSPFNKVTGLGFDGPVRKDDFHRIERIFAERGAPVRVELATLADPSVGAALTARGYRLAGFENVLGHALQDLPSADSDGSDVEVDLCGEEDFETWLDTVVTAFLNPDEDGMPAHESYPREPLEEAVRSVARATGHVRYLARRDGEPAGGASMRVGGGVALLTGAATLPAHRRRGAQGVLLSRRLRDAAAAGCEVAVVATQPGSTSQRNVQRSGFELLYARAILESG